MKKSQLYTFIIATIVALGGFLLGFDGVVNSGAINFYKATFNISNNALLLGISTSAILLGSILGNLTAGYIGDLIGRKKTLLLTALLFMIGAAGTALSPNIVLFIACKFVAGIGVGVAILIAPIYIAELAPPSKRGQLVTINQLNIVLGLSIAYFSNYYILQQVQDPDVNWRWMLGVGFFPALLYFLLLFLVPESPRWLISKGNDARAKAIMTKVGGEVHAQKEYNNVKESLSQTRNQHKASFKDVFNKKMKTVLIIGFALAFFQQVSGINAVLYYAPMIFQTAGGGTDAAFLQATIVGVIFVIMTIVSMLLIDKAGRKPLLILGCSIMAAFLTLTAVAFYQATYDLNRKNIDKILAEAKANHKNNTETINYTQSLQVLNKALTKHENQTFDHEVAFFNTIENDFKYLLNHEGSSGTRSSFSQELYANLYKPLILKNTININSTWVLFGILGFISGFSISLGPVMWAMLSEIFPNHVRGLAISIVGSLNALTSFSVATIFPLELMMLGSATTFFIFAGFMIACVLFVIRYVVETKGKSLEEIEKELVIN